MNTQLEPRAALVMKPLDIVDSQNQTRFEFAIDRLETQVCHYITTQAQIGAPLQIHFLKDLFFQAKRIIRRG